MGLVIRWLIALGLGLSLLPWTAVMLARVWRDGSSLVFPLPVTLAAAISLALAFWKRPCWFVHTLIHEACHALLCIMLGVRIRNFSASNGQGGQVSHDATDPIRGTIISLAPYTIPLLLLPPLLILQFLTLSPQYLPYTHAAVAFFYVHHLHALYHNVRLNFWGRQSDLHKAGRPLSVVAITSCLLLVTAWTLALLRP